MKIFASLVVALLLAALTFFGLVALSPVLRAWQPIVGNLAFIIWTAALISVLKKDAFESSRATVLSPILFILFLIGCGAGALLFSLVSQEVADIFILPLSVIGYSPAGPDSYLAFTVLTYLASVPAVIATGLGLGMALRKLRLR